MLGKMTITGLILSFLLLRRVSCYIDGSRLHSYCIDMDIKHSFGSEGGSRPYTITPSSATLDKDEVVEVVLSSTVYIKGFMMDGRNDNDQRVPVGFFVSLGQPNTNRLLNCRGSPNTTMVHRDNQKKRTISGQWKAPEKGTFVFDAAVVGDASWWNRNPPPTTPATTDMPKTSNPTTQPSTTPATTDMPKTSNPTTGPSTTPDTVTTEQTTPTTTDCTADDTTIISNTSTTNMTRNLKTSASNLLLVLMPTISIGCAGTGIYFAKKKNNLKTQPSPTPDTVTIKQFDTTAVPKRIQSNITGRTIPMSNLTTQPSTTPDWNSNKRRKRDSPPENLSDRIYCLLPVICHTLINIILMAELMSTFFLVCSRPQNPTTQPSISSTPANDSTTFTNDFQQVAAVALLLISHFLHLEGALFLLGYKRDLISHLVYKVLSLFSLCAVFIAFVFFLLCSHTIVSALTGVAMILSLIQTIVAFTLCGPSHELRDIMMWVLRTLATLQAAFTVVGIFVLQAFEYGGCTCFQYMMTGSTVWTSVFCGICVVLTRIDCNSNRRRKRDAPPAVCSAENLSDRIYCLLPVICHTLNNIILIAGFISTFFLVCSRPQNPTSQPSISSTPANDSTTFKEPYDLQQVAAVALLLISHFLHLEGALFLLGYKRDLISHLVYKVLSLFSLCAVFIAFIFFLLCSHTIVSAFTGVAMILSLIQTIVAFTLCGPSHELRDIMMWVLRTLATLQATFTVVGIFVLQAFEYGGCTCFQYMMTGPTMWTLVFCEIWVVLKHIDMTSQKRVPATPIRVSHRLWVTESTVWPQ
ncbi:uncharacterized protein LOC121677604 isoform X1 [Alosa sapidissima]|uniref:uncharacterized protein LOC121677604 isoform X1 n=1 Tax=Alosa sapidissima TaxID=34773 RepID=UPI001C08A778|nr:uncharacterized protein LOC121677604 isoform X1 [Alosa sapidissima]